MNRRADIDRFYALLEYLRAHAGGPRCLGDPHARNDLPRRGIYFFFENGELREDFQTPRVVRIGTHAVSAGSRTTLWNRLAQHRGRTRGKHPGGGNHRCSIFRLHVGTALLNRGLSDAAAAVNWGTAARPPDEVLREAEYQVELAVSHYIRSMPFLWLAVDDAPGKQSHRNLIETNAIALLSNHGREPIDPPSPGWLGRWADREAVRKSGLWNVNHVEEECDSDFLNCLELYIFQT